MNRSILKESSTVKSQMKTLFTVCLFRNECFVFDEQTLEPFLKLDGQPQ